MDFYIIDIHSDVISFVKIFLHFTYRTIPTIFRFRRSKWVYFILGSRYFRVAVNHFPVDNKPLTLPSFATCVKRGLRGHVTWQNVSKCWIALVLKGGLIIASLVSVKILNLFTAGWCTSISLSIRRHFISSTPLFQRLVICRYSPSWQVLKALMFWTSFGGQYISLLYGLCL